MDEVVAVIDAKGSLHLGPRMIPVPKSLSAEAQEFLAAPALLDKFPPVSDKAGWRQLAAAVGKSYEPIAVRTLQTMPASVSTSNIAGATVHFGTPNQIRHSDWAHLTIHGGGWVFLGGKYAMAQAAIDAVNLGCATFSLDYAMAPDHPFPAALEEGVVVYREIVKSYDPRKVAISGGSAGGNLTAAVTLKIRDLGLPLPGAVGLITPALDFTLGGDTIRANLGVDKSLGTALELFIALYADGHDLMDPYLSPLFADYEQGFPPTFLQAGTRDLLLSDTVRMHRKLLQSGVPTELHIWEAMPHGGFGGVSPEDEEIRTQFAKFVERHLAGP
jgi:monoterpene epsilon-lactone hydrolase